MKMSRWLMALCPLFFVALASGSAWAEDEAERKFKANNELVKKAAKTNEQCGTKIEVDLDYDGFAPKIRKRYALGSWCEHVLEQLRYLCRGPKTKAHIAKRVLRYRCTQSDGKPRKVTIDKGTATLYIDFDASNYAQFVRRALVRQL